MAKQNTVAGFTDSKRVRELVALMTENHLTEIELVEGKSKIVLKRGAQTAGSADAPAPMHHQPPSHGASLPRPATPPAEEFTAIKSPMVGTFYSSANPESDPYVTIGSEVTGDTVLCIIEAMKVFNEIRSDPPISGTVAKILVQNGQVVEYNQPLFLVKPL